MKWLWFGSSDSPDGERMQSDLEKAEAMMGDRSQRGVQIIYDQNSPDAADPLDVEECIELAKLAVDSFNKDNPHARYSRDAVELVLAIRDGAFDYLNFTIIPSDDDDDVDLMIPLSPDHVSVCPTFESKVWRRHGSVRDARVISVKIVEPIAHLYSISHCLQ